MNVVFKHVPIAELPKKWREKLAASGEALVTVRIEEELTTSHATVSVADDPAFGIWRDREDLADVTAYVRKLRKSRYDRAGNRKEP